MPLKWTCVLRLRRKKRREERVLNKINWRVRVRVQVRERMRTYRIIYERIQCKSYSANTISVHWTNQWVYQRITNTGTTHTQMWHIAKCNKVQHSGKHSWQNAQQQKKELCTNSHSRIKLINTTYLLLCRCCCFFLIVSFLSVLLLLFSSYSAWFRVVLLCFAWLCIIWILMAKNRNISLA